MRSLHKGLWWHAIDREALRVAAPRFVLCTLVVLVPLTVGIPTQHQPVSITYFLPLIFGVLGALTLRESTQWLQPRNRTLWTFRAAVTVAGDLVCLAALVLSLRAGTPERIGILAGALVAMSVGLVVACVAQDLAWLGAAVVGFACLVSFDRAVILYVPLIGAIVGYCAALLTFAVLGPRSLGVESE